MKESLELGSLELLESADELFAFFLDLCDGHFLVSGSRGALLAHGLRRMHFFVIGSRSPDLQLFVGVFARLGLFAGLFARLGHLLVSGSRGALLAHGLRRMHFFVIGSRSPDLQTALGLVLARVYRRTADLIAGSVLFVKGMFNVRVISFKDMSDCEPFFCRKFSTIS
jgi:hypothetical protein